MEVVYQQAARPRSSGLTPFEDTATSRNGFAVMGLSQGIGRACATVKRWFDSEAGGSATTTEAGGHTLEWGRTLPFFAMHLACLAVIWVGWSPVAVAVAVALYFVRMFAVTGFLHRYFSHRTFKTSRWFQFVMALWTGTCVQRGPLWWAAHHRAHHRHSDTDEDIHSPITQGLLWSHMLWITSRANDRTDMTQVKDLARYPELRWLNRFDTLVPLLFGAGLFCLWALLAAVARGLGTRGWQMLVWLFFISTIVLFHGTCLINSMGLLFGRRRYETDDHSRNSMILALITLGEGWHNNHHHYPAATRQGFFWWEIDITYYGLVALKWLGLIGELKGVPEKVRRPEAGLQPAAENRATHSLEQNLPMTPEMGN